MLNVIDVGSRAEYPGNVLSNFFPNRFIFDGIVCLSSEGPLQSFKFEDFAVQKKICKLVGKAAKKEGSLRNEIWQSKQTLWWRGKAYKRESPEYQILLDRVFRALTKNSDFRKALLATKKAVLTHSIGESDPKKTILTESEFCSRLTEIRKILQRSYRERLFCNSVVELGVLERA